MGEAKRRHEARTAEVHRIAKQARATYGRDGKAFPNSGRRNAYRCEADPSHVIVTIDREPGVTPFMTVCERCRAAGVKGQAGMSAPVMLSSMYRVPQDLHPTHEWYRPDTLEGLSAGVLEHVRNGGLLLRPITGSKRTAPGDGSDG